MPLYVSKPVVYYTLFLCRRRRTIRELCVCGDDIEETCGYSLRGRRAGEFCARRSCARCAIQIGDVFYCQPHARMIQSRVDVVYHRDIVGVECQQCGHGAFFHVNRLCGGKVLDAEDGLHKRCRCARFVKPEVKRRAFA